MITEERKIHTTNKKRRHELSEEIKKTKGIPHYLKITKELISNSN
jgi:hypothetical protein